MSAAVLQGHPSLPLFLRRSTLKNGLWVARPIFIQDIARHANTILFWAEAPHFQPKGYMHIFELI
jgi:hypothetical protein